MNEHIENARNVVNGWAAVLAADAEAQAAIVARQQQAARELGDVTRALEQTWPAQLSEEIVQLESPRGDTVDEQVQRLIHEARAALDRAEALLVQRRIQPVEYKELPAP